MNSVRTHAINTVNRPFKKMDECATGCGNVTFYEMSNERAEGSVRCETCFRRFCSECRDEYVNSDETRKALEYLKKLMAVNPPEVYAWDDAGNNRWIISGKGSGIMNPPSSWAVAKRDNPKVAENIWHHSMPIGPKGRYVGQLPQFYGLWSFAIRLASIIGQFFVNWGVAGVVLIGNHTATAQGPGGAPPASREGAGSPAERAGAAPDGSAPAGPGRAPAGRTPARGPAGGAGPCRRGAGGRCGSRRRRRSDARRQSGSSLRLA